MQFLSKLYEKINECGLVASVYNRPTIYNQIMTLCFYTVNKTWSVTTMNCLLESSISMMFPVGLGS